MSVCVNVGVHGIQKKVLDPLKLELTGDSEYLMWALGTELWSSKRAASAFTHRAVFSTLEL